MKHKMELEEELVTLLKERHLTLALAESCTGGLLSGRIVNVSGVSEVLKAGFVTYTEEAKHNILGVSNETLEKETAVSRKTAEEMVIGAARKADTQVAISVTGLAGPGGGTSEKPVGLVYIGSYLKGKIKVVEYHFKGDRNDVRIAAVEAAIRQTISMLKSE